MWNLGFGLAVKYPAIACGTFQRLRAFVTFDGIFMRPGYELGSGCVWDRGKNIFDDDNSVW